MTDSHARFEPAAFDRGVAGCACFRPPQNRSPDIDPDPHSTTLRMGPDLRSRVDRRAVRSGRAMPADYR